MPNTKYLDDLAFSAVNDKVGSVRHDPFAGPADGTRPPHLGMGQELHGGIPDTLRHFLRGDRIVFSDVLLRFNKVR